MIDLETTEEERAFIHSVVKPGGTMGWKEVDELLRDFDRLASQLAAEKERADDKESDCVRLVHEKADHFEARVAAEARADKAEAALEPITSTDHDDEMDRFLFGVEGVVEATSCERHDLWESWHQGRSISWVSDNSGLLATIGTFGGMPICLSLFKVKVDGHLILFYHATSMVVHHEIVEMWLEAQLPQTARLINGRVNKTDAMNFHNIFHNIKYARAALEKKP